MQQLLHDFSSKSESERLENCDVSPEMSQSGTTRSTKRVLGPVVTAVNMLSSESMLQVILTEDTEIMHLMIKTDARLPLTPPSSPQSSLAPTTHYQSHARA